MKSNLPGTYRAKCSSDDGVYLTAYIPQVFGETRVQIREIIGQRPAAADFGWVMFEGGDPAYPVWMTPEVAAPAPPSPDLWEYTGTSPTDLHPLTSPESFSVTSTYMELTAGTGDGLYVYGGSEGFVEVYLGGSGNIDAVVTSEKAELTLTAADSQTDPLLHVVDSSSAPLLNLYPSSLAVQVPAEFSSTTATDTVLSTRYVNIYNPDPTLEIDAFGRLNFDGIYLSRYYSGHAYLEVSDQRDINTGYSVRQDVAGGASGWGLTLWKDGFAYASMTVLDETATLSGQSEFFVGTTPHSNNLRLNGDYIFLGTYAQTVMIAHWTSAPTDADIPEHTTAWWVDETNNQIKFRTRYSGSTYKTGSIALT